jgi:NAD(P)-dependent dehydrogenase (short-subunit alcohol dehydrogenase family)
MVGKLLSLDLKDQGVVVGIVHPGFMRTEMTKGVGFDKFWDDGGGESSLHFRGFWLGGLNWIGRKERGER